MVMKKKAMDFASFSILLLILPFSISSPDSDSDALLAFKSSLEDPSPDSLSSWSNNGGSSTTSPCNWFGVTCNSSTRRVVKLVLNHLNLTASIQPLIQLTHLRHLSLHHNHLSSSSAAVDLSPLQNLKHLYLSHNRFRGKFPAGISKLRRLRRLDFSYNHFTGHIPFEELTHLTSLLTLRLEFNSFTGGLITRVSPNLSITDFNVSGNELAGSIPNWLSKFPVTSFAGNNHLCGNPLPSICPIPDSSNKKPKRRLGRKTVATIIAINVIALIVIAITIAYFCRVRNYRREARKKTEEKKRNRHYYSGRRSSSEAKMVYFDGCKGFAKVDDLLKASAEMLGKGIVGTTYKVTMDGGDTMVVKRIRERKLRKEFDAGLKAIGGVRHHNIVSLRAYYYSKDELLLVYDFLSNGSSLHSLLHGNRGPGRTPLDWTTRLKLALGSANGLSFLHSQNNSKLFHGHLSSSNIIVDQKGNPSLSDNGLYQIFHTFPNSSTTTTTTTQCAAPELANSDAQYQNPKFMQRCDVYSFGVILLEILTGKTATGEGETALAKWVKRAIIGIEDGDGGIGIKWKKWDVFDFELVRYKEMEEEMRALLGVAMMCVVEVPKNRPKMEVVRRKIEEIMTLGGGGGGGVSSVDDHQSDSSPALSETTANFTSS